MQSHTDDQDKKIHTHKKRSERGSVFTVLLAGIAIAGALSVVLYQTISGPMSSMVRVTNKTSTKQQMQAVANIIIMDAANNMPANGDCTGLGYVVPRSFRPGTGVAGTAYPANGGFVPSTIGAPLTDPWGTSYGYCVWEMGVGTGAKPAGCDTVGGYNQTCTASGGCGAGSGYNAYRLKGSSSPTGGNSGSQTVIAIISAGPDRKFSSSCADYTNGTTNVVTAGGDDIVLQYTYAEASAATSSLWTIDTAHSSQADIGKNITIGTNAVPYSTISGNTALSNMYNAGGLVNAAAVVTQGAIIAGGVVQLADNAVTNITSNAVTDSTCNGASGPLQVGALRYNTTSNAVELCKCTGTWSVGSPSTCSASTWTPVGTSTSSFSGLTPAAATNAIDNTNYAQTWQWSTLTTGTGLLLNTAATNNLTSGTVLGVASSSTAASGNLFYSSLTGAGNTGVAVYGANSSTAAGSYGGYFYNANNATAGNNGAALGINGFETMVGIANAKQPAVSAAGTARIYYDTTNGLMVSTNTGAYTNILTGSGGLAINSLSDAYTDYTNKNIILGSTAAATKPALGAGAQYDTYLGLNAGNITSSNTATGNTGVGYASLGLVTLGIDNTALGYGALYSNAGGGNNTAIGYGAMYYAYDIATSSARWNTAVGINALRGSSTASSNTGNLNTAIGAQSLLNNTTGAGNSVLGVNGLLTNASGSYNNAIGYLALYSNTIGIGNTADGYGALYSNAALSYNTAIGFKAMYYANSDAVTNTATGNTALGSYALTGSVTAANNTGTSNTALGAWALTSATNGGSNTAVGAQALQNSAAGSSNTALGYQAGTAGTAITTGSQNTLIGANAQVNSAAAVNRTAIGYNASANADNTLILGNGANVGIGTSTPAEKLHIYTGASGGTPYLDNPMLVLESSARANIQFLSPSTADSQGLYFGNNVSNVAGQITYAPNTGAFDFYTNGASRLHILSSGNVGIGTATPNVLLDLSTSSGSANTVLNIETPGTGTAQQAALEFVTKSDGSSLGTATNLGWQLSARGNAFTGQGNYLQTYYWNGTTWTNPMSLFPSGNVTFGTQGMTLTVGTSGANANILAIAPTTGAAAPSSGSSVINTLGDAMTDYTHANIVLGTFDGSTKPTLGGSYNTYMGLNAGDLIAASDTANDNTGYGYKALGSATTGADNVAVGYMALASAQAGANNVALGSGAGNVGTALTTGSNDIFIGYNAQMNGQYSNATAIGSGAIVTGSNMIQLGTTGGSQVVRLPNGTTASDPTCNASTMGAIHYNTTNNNFEGCQGSTLAWGGFVSNIGGLTDAMTDYTNFNIIIGSTGSSTKPALGGGAQYNTYLGANAGNITTGDTGAGNTGVGYLALGGVTNGASNTAVGYGAGYAGTANTTGSQNTFIGTTAGIASANSQVSNSTAIGYGAQVTNSNSIQLGNTSVTNVNVGGPGTTLTVGSSSASTNIVAIAPTTGMGAPVASAFAGINVWTYCPSGCKTICSGASCGTYTLPANLLYLTVEVVGGGGGGGGSTNGGYYGNGGGGGGGGYARKTLAASDPSLCNGVCTGSQTVTISVGTGGTAGAASGNGGAGGTSSFGTLAVATGGGGGGGEVTSTGTTGFYGGGGAGGAGTVGDITVTGSGGSAAIRSTGYVVSGGGAGGSSYFGGGAPGTAWGDSGYGTNGIAGSKYGGGGSGGAGYNLAYPGGAGAAGMVMITAYTY